MKTKLANKDARPEEMPRNVNAKSASAELSGVLMKYFAFARYSRVRRDRRGLQFS
jgi:hypothetical protein